MLIEKLNHVHENVHEDADLLHEYSSSNKKKEVDGQESPGYLARCQKEKV